MHKNCRINEMMRVVICFSLSSLLIWSCAAPKEKVSDPFFEKWRARAEESKGYSPPAPVPSGEKYVELTGKLPPEPKAPEKIKPLPTRNISLKMTNIDVPVLLRALARAAGVNIIVSERVSGKININIHQAPWDQVFVGILRTQSLGYAWEGDILRIMTATDMEEDLKSEVRKKEMQLAEPPITRIVPIKYSSADRLQEVLQRFLSLDRNDKPIGAIMVDVHTNSLIIQAIRQNLETILAVVNQLDKPTPQVLIEAHIVEASKDVARELGIQWGGLAKISGQNGTGFVTGQNNNALGGTVGQAVDPNSGLAVDLPASPLGGLSPFSLGVVYQNVGDVLLSVQLSALQEQGKLNILSSPSITTLDNQTAFIESGSDVPFQTVEDGQVNVEYKKAVLSLRVIPHVIDNNTLKMYINVHKDQPDFSNTVLGNPTINTKNAETNVIQFNGQTVVIGGLNQQTNTDRKTGVPLFEDIPGLGYLFKKKSNSNEMEDLLIFITPYILKPPASGG
jgi:type IV pilus assembly protein PilQ